MWDPQRLTNLWASMACYRESFYLLRNAKIHLAIGHELFLPYLFKFLVQ
jgi:hypothetical protein